eukprot:CAMPEP_0198732768 /NCGR_PEP_ID=MMETSP1475-20131203/39175_1 /TAXON_ID= ORGANISM="Unidentified sp., Strain CCMP1999" /NCGR_SAMPLE_ID=MMETSP1475 /ASSEMBLY_ACC=CAM_ASM_001111 /LENGTH=318 /DNA_ID=CAMNT_0044495937 /DNA_START=228 /DNA_END=1184 /DNA_ORIENTATION=-
MKAFVSSRYGPPNEHQLQEVSRPVPKDDEVLIRVKATSVNPKEWHIIRGDPFFVRLALGLRKPKHEIVGSDVAGIVEQVGKDVTKLNVGDEVFGDIDFGAFAQYACVKKDLVQLKPAGLSFEEAAAVPLAATTALQALRTCGKLQADQHVLINGAGGGVGSFAVQLAKNMGATVTAVCSGDKAKLVSSLGADSIIDYRKEDYTSTGRQYDLIIDTALYRPVLENTPALKKHGRYVLVGGDRFLTPMVVMPLASTAMSKHMMICMAKSDSDDLGFLRDQLVDGKLRPIISKTYKFAQLAEAISEVERGHVAGKVVVTMD